ncbi:MAG: hypothetical protein IKU07_00625 [Oscillospiraceae bacterium]|nr:hypothetical protein [Oscillospiraceae bacterium]
MSNTPTVILNGDQIYIDELIRENARLTIQHEADKQIMDRLREQSVDAEAYEAKMAEVYAYADKAKQEVEYAKSVAQNYNAKLQQAIADLHFVMAGGDPCKVCTVKCAFGAGNCKPVWRGEEDGQ